MVRAEGCVPRYGAYDTMCASGACLYNNGTPIPGFEIVGPAHLAQATYGGPTSCDNCELDADCPAAEVCNTAGICQP